MAYPEGFLEELKARLRLAEVIGKRVRLVRKGREFHGLCPFHNEKTPSFTVNEDKGFFHCFGCGAHGSVFDFVMLSENIGFAEAVARLAGEVGMSLPASSRDDDARQQRSRDLRDALDGACAYYQRMLRMPEGKAALDYLLGRGVNEDSIARFRLGYATGGRSALKAALARDGVPESVMIEAGLLVASEGERASYDRFRGRIMFPIADSRGRLVGFGGRILNHSQPKYLNSPETALFQKGHLLYGLALAREAVRQHNRVIVVEGYMDVIGLAQAGFAEVVAPLGTALTEHQLDSLWRLAPEPILWFDPDPAGERAALRAAELALPRLRAGFGLKFAFSRLDSADDPADLARRYDTMFVQQTLAAALPLSELLFRVASRGCRMERAEDRAALHQRLDQQLARITDSTLRRHYQAVARDRLRRLTAPVRGSRDRPHLAAPAAAPTAVEMSARALAEQNLLALLLHHPDLFDEVEEELGRITFAENAFDALRQGLITALSGRIDRLDTASLRLELDRQGVGDIAASILRQPVVRFVYGSARANRDELHARWRDALAAIAADDARAEQPPAAGPWQQWRT